MDQLFKQNLLRLRYPEAPKTFADALIPNPFLPRPPSPRPHLSEQVSIVESLKTFVEEKLESSTLKVEGGEIALKDSTLQVPRFSSFFELKATLSKELPQKKPLVLFVTETFRNEDEVAPELKEGFVNELIRGFPVKTAELFERMILAMKLIPDEVVLYPVEADGKDLSGEVMSIIGFMRPEVVITLGAKATHKILKNNDRLTLIHGQFFKRTINTDVSFQLVPLFHPSIIETNQNMKKTAWADMQKIMKHLKKLP
jgi:Uracil DNA glycosylase superfamily